MWRGAVSHSERTAQQRHLSVPHLPNGLRGRDRALDNCQLEGFRLHYGPAGRIPVFAAGHPNFLRTLRDAADLSAHQLRGKAIDVTTVTLDDPDAFPPEGHVWTSHKLSWMKLADGLPSFEEGTPS